MSIETAATECRERFKNSKVGDPVWCCHHEELHEKLEESAEARIAYILSAKPEHEQELRLNEFRPVIAVVKYNEIQAKCKPLDDDYIAKCQLLHDELEALHKAEYPETKWNGKSIFE